MNFKELFTSLVASGLFTGQVIFSVGYIGTCEAVNLLGPRNLTLCEGRWATVIALFFPSGLQKGAGAVTALNDKRKGLFRG
jgi:hypothetical protein